MKCSVVHGFAGPPLLTHVGRDTSIETDIHEI